MSSKDILYDYAMSFVGLPYKWGGDDPIKGFDCSGFILELLWSQGLAPQRDTTAQGIYDYWFKKKGQTSSKSFGALSFYGRSLNRITHVGFCLSKELMIEAGGGGSRTKSKEDAATQNAYLRLRPIKKRSDFLVCVLPDWPHLSPRYRRLLGKV